MNFWDGLDVRPAVDVRPADAMMGCLPGMRSEDPIVNRSKEYYNEDKASTFRAETAQFNLTSIRTT